MVTSPHQKVQMGWCCSHLTKLSLHARQYHNYRHKRTQQQKEGEDQSRDCRVVGWWTAPTKNTWSWATQTWYLEHYIEQKKSTEIKIHEFSILFTWTTMTNRSAYNGHVYTWVFNASCVIRSQTASQDTTPFASPRCLAEQLWSNFVTVYIISTRMWKGKLPCNIPSLFSCTTYINAPLHFLAPALVTKTNAMSCINDIFLLHICWGCIRMD